MSDPSMFEWANPPAEWLEERRKNALALVANAAIGPTEPTPEQRERSAIAQTLLWLGGRIEALEKRNDELLADAARQPDRKDPQ